MTAFDPTAYGPVLADLLREPRLQPLGAGQPHRAYQAQLARLSLDTAFAHAKVVDPDMAACCLAAVWLYHDFLEESHCISQRVGSREGSYWHGIMHRREGDFWNSGYWFRRVGRHPVFEPLRLRAAQLATNVSDAAVAFLVRSTAWDPCVFNDLCEAAVRGNADKELLCRQIQQAEWEILFDYCYWEAIQA